MTDRLMHDFQVLFGTRCRHCWNTISCLPGCKGGWLR